MSNPPPPRAANPNQFCPLPDRGHDAVRGGGGDSSSPDQSKHGRSTYSPPVWITSRVAEGGIPGKGVDTNQLSPMGEPGGVGTIHVGIYHAPDEVELDHLGPDFKR